MKNESLENEKLEKKSFEHACLMPQEDQRDSAKT